jgi:hypothetical protein
LLVSMLVHEPLELLAILCVAKIFHEFREFALGGDELLAFFFQPCEFSCAPFVESVISGRAHAITGGAGIAQAAGTARPARRLNHLAVPNKGFLTLPSCRRADDAFNNRSKVLHEVLDFASRPGIQPGQYRRSLLEGDDLLLSNDFTVLRTML